MLFYLTHVSFFGFVVASFTVYQDFYSYRSGVYTHTTGSAVGGHAIKMLGLVLFYFLQLCFICNITFCCRNLFPSLVSS